MTHTSLKAMSPLWNFALNRNRNPKAAQAGLPKTWVTTFEPRLQVCGGVAGKLNAHQGVLIHTLRLLGAQVLSRSEGILMPTV